MKRVFLSAKTTIIILVISLFTGNYGSLNEELTNRLSDNSSAGNEFFTSNFFLETSQPVVSFLSEEHSIKDNSVYKNLRQLCSYTKLPFSSISINNINNKEYLIPTSVKTICIDRTVTISKPAIKKLIEFVANGGSLVVTNIVYDSHFNYLLGLKANEEEHSYNNNAKGFKLTNQFIPNTDNTNFYEKGTHFGFNKSSFNNDVEVMITAVNDTEYPVILKNNIGLGKVIFFNSSIEISKYERGLLFTSLLSTLEGVPYPVANVSTIFLDDFPSPIYDLKKEPIKSEYNVTNQEFVNNIWWPDMVSLSKKHNIKYTATIIFDYEENTIPPFSFKEWERTKQNNMAVPHIVTKDLLANNHELAIHGYNHVSLLEKDWSKETIGFALKTVKKKWKLNNYGELPVSYIPPSNHIDKVGVQALKANLPSIKYMCSVYTGEKEMGGDREYEPEPYAKNMFGFPRVTSGYYLDSDKRYLKESTYLFTGIWSHFIHPDDVYQIPDESNSKTRGSFSYRNEPELNWKKDNKKGLKGMLPTFDAILEKHSKTYPFTKYTDVKEAGRRVADIRLNSYKHDVNSDYYSVTNLNRNKNQDWFVYVSSFQKGKVIDYLQKNKIQYHQIPLHNGVLLGIKTQKNKITIPAVSPQRNKFLTNHVLASYNALFNKKVDQNEAKKELSLAQKTNLLRTKLFTSDYYNEDDWKTYLTYCSWQQKEKQFWYDLDAYFNENKQFEIANFSDEAAKTIWYTNEKDSRKWLVRKTELAPSKNLKISFIKEYIKKYNSEKNVIDISNKLKELAMLNPTSENKTNYASYVLWSEVPNKEQILYRLKPSKDYVTLAKEITWYFKDKKYYDKMLAWSDINEEIPVNTKFYWLFEAKEYTLLDTYFKEYISKNPTDDLAKKTMSQMYLERKDFLNAWKIASTINSNSKEYESLRKQLNYEFTIQNKKLQNEFIKANDVYLFAKVRDSIERVLILEGKNSITFSSVINTDRDNIASFERLATYSMVTDNLNVHSISATNTSVSALQGNNSAENVDKELYGIEYKFESSRRGNDKLNYHARTRLETDRENYYYHAGAGVNYNVDNTFISAEYEVAPVKNGAAYTKNIYKNKVGIYAEKNFKNKLNAIAYVEGNYYSDNEKNLTSTLSLSYPVFSYGSHQIRPALEGTYSVGSADLRQGFPYWMVKERLFGGGGLQYQLNTDMDKTFAFVDAMVFSDSYATYFTRFRGQVNFQLQKYFIVNFNGELYLNDQYYSNSFNIGLLYLIK